MFEFGIPLSQALREVKLGFRVWGLGFKPYVNANCSNSSIYSNRIDWQWSKLIIERLWEFIGLGALQA